MPQLELPTFIVEKYRALPNVEITAGAGKVTCPRADCGKTFIVHITGWYKDRTYTDVKGQEHKITGRPCPYCFRSAALPPRAGIR